MFVLHHISSLVHSCKLLCPAENLPADGALGRKTENVGKTTSRLRNVIFQKKMKGLKILNAKVLAKKSKIDKQL